MPTLHSCTSATLSLARSCWLPELLLDVLIALVFHRAVASHLPARSTQCQYLSGGSHCSILSFLALMSIISSNSALLSELYFQVFKVLNIGLSSGHQCCKNRHLQSIPLWTRMPWNSGGHVLPGIRRFFKLRENAIIIQAWLKRSPSQQKRGDSGSSQT